MQRISKQRPVGGKHSNPLSFYCFRASSNNGQTINNNTEQTLIFEDEDYDYRNIYSTVTGKYIPVTAGVYHFDAYCLLDNHSWHPTEIAIIGLKVDGVTKAAGTRKTYHVNTTEYCYLHVHSDLYVAANKDVKVFVYQNSGENFAIYADSPYNYFSGFRVK